jgi:hypothetical protein
MRKKKERLEKPDKIKVNLKEIPKEVLEKNRSTAYDYIV